MDLIAAELESFAEAVGTDDAVAIVGHRSRGGVVSSCRVVAAPAGIREFLPEEMIVRCGAGTPVAELAEALGAAGQYVPIPRNGTVGGALAVGQSSLLRLGRGPIRDALLQAHFVNARGRVVKAGGPTVKNVTGFDLCRLLVGSRGTLGFMGEVILRTKPVPEASRWFRLASADPWSLLRDVYRPSAVLWNGAEVWLCLEGHPDDIRARVARLDGAIECDGPPPLPSGSRRSVAPDKLADLRGEFVAEVGVGIVHHAERWPDRPRPSPAVVQLNRRIKSVFDPTGRLNPGVDVLEEDTAS